VQYRGHADRLTGGLSIDAHRAKTSAAAALSFPFFFDPGFDAKSAHCRSGRRRYWKDREVRWDRQSVHEFSGPIGDYLLAKVSKVFPELRREVIS